MANKTVAVPLGGLIPSDPRLIPGINLALTAGQQRQLKAISRQAMNPAEVIRDLREALQRREPLTAILETLRQRQALEILRQYAASPDQWAMPHRQVERSPLVRTAPPAPRPPR